MAQIQSVTNVTGEAVILKNISESEAEKNALDDAKSNAIKRVVGETIIAKSTLRTDDNDQVYNEFLKIESQGNIISYDIVDQTIKTDELGNRKILVTIDAKVKKYETKKDPSFLITIQGVEEVYKNGEVLDVIIIPNKEGFLKVFMFDKKEAFMLFPNSFDDNKLFQEKNEHSLFQYSQMTMVKSNHLKEESGYLLFVFTKKDVPFTEYVSYDNILSWIYGMEPDQRFVELREYRITD